MKRLKILVVDDEPNILKSMRSLLEMSGYEVETANASSQAIRILEQGGFQVLLTDVKMQNMNGLELANIVRSKFPDVTLLIMTAYGSIKDAVAAIKMGAFDYLTKPVDGEELLAILDKIAAHRALIDEVQSLRIQMRTLSAYPGLVGASAAMHSVYDFIKKASQNDLSILITGETGTGKSLIAKVIHQQSPRAKGPLVLVNCGALPELLMESELFGHQKGAFTGAIQERKGKILSAHGGTLFLDEVATLSFSAQAKLLQALEEKQFDPVGGDKPVRVDIRVIAATNADLSVAVEAGKFRKDLYYRLKVMSLRAPPLKERKEDIPLLADFFLKHLNRGEFKIDPAAMKLLLIYDWPGNVRELENVIKAAAVDSQKLVISVDDLPQSIRGQDTVPAFRFANSFSMKDKIGVFEKYLIEEALRRTRGNITRAARELACPLRSMKRKIAYYQIQPRKFAIFTKKK